MDASLSFSDLTLELSLDVDPAPQGLDLAAPGVGGDAAYEWCVDRHDPTSDTCVLRWRLRRRDGAPFTVRGFTAQTQVPAVDVHRVFVPVLHDGIGKRDWISLPWGVRERSFATWSFPLIALLSRRDRNRFCMALMDHVHVAEATQSCYDEDARLGLARPQPWETTCWEDGLYLSRAARPALDEVRAFARGHDAFHRRQGPPAPPAVWDPAWCSWYGIKTQVTAAYIARMAPLLADWGFGSVIVDAGWFREDGFSEATGHYVADPAKFPDLAGLVRQVQSHNLRILLWYAPLFGLGNLRQHAFLERHLYRPADGVEGPLVLCPRSPAVRAYVRRTVHHLMTAHGADGLKVDFIDPLMDRACLPCTADHEHDTADYGEAVVALLHDIRETATAARSDALLEFRMNYSTLATRDLATSHRAQDAPFDADHIRRMCARLKSYILDPERAFDNPAAVHTDPAYWLPQEPPANVARFMASLVTSAVPMLSMDLGALPAEHQRIVRAWLRFYRQHRDTILFGAHELLDSDPHHSLFALRHQDRCVWGIFTPGVPGRLQVPSTAVRRLWLLNGSQEDRLFVRLEGLGATRWQAQVRDRGLEPRAMLELQAAGGAAVLDVAVEEGGAVELWAGDAAPGAPAPG